MANHLTFFFRLPTNTTSYTSYSNTLKFLDPENNFWDS